MTEVWDHNVIFIRDGSSMGGPCSIKSCAQYSDGIFEVLDADSNEYLITIELCAKHATELAIGG